MPLIPLLLIALVSATLCGQAAKPNIILVMTDDQGWADIGSQGPGCKTPHLDRMAKEGLRLTSFYATQAVCTSSRAALLTGCYPNRIGLGGRALFPGEKVGLNPDEETVAELLRDAGYRTGMSGKWHLGDRKPFLPPDHGFEESLILPYSNDMWPLRYRSGQTQSNHPPLPWIEDGKVVGFLDSWEAMDGATARQFDWAEGFVKRHAGKDRPFFLYIAPSMPHTPLGASADFKGKGPTPYAEVIAEIDARMGRLLTLLRETGADADTLVIFTSDNGPWLNFGDHAGSAGPFREGKGTTWEGGVRVPFVARWPRGVPAGRVSDALAANLDVLPTLVDLAGARRPAKPIDGQSFAPLLQGKSAQARESFLYFYGDNLHAVRKGKWKLLLEHGTRTYEGLAKGTDGAPGPIRNVKVPPALHNLDADPGERKDVAAQNPRVVEELRALAAKGRQDLTAGKRPIGRIGEAPAPASPAR
jgi:arylsulfatase A-like enzyme